MKKRFALIIAGGLIVVLIAGSAALSLGLLGAAPAAGGDRSAPRVRTIHHTVTIHKKAKAEPAIRTVVLSASSGGGSSVAGGGYESESESEFEGPEGSGDGNGGSEAFDD